MITQTHTALCRERYLTAFGLVPEECIFFDIETTGFRASTSHLYMIGYGVKGASGKEPGGEGEQGSLWTITQVLAESTMEEAAVLKAFAQVMKRYRTVIHFNGDRFDIPYLEEKYRELHIRSPFDGMRTVDIYQSVRPFRRLLGMDRLNQKSVERFLGIRRKDPYNGGQLIEVYRSVRDGRSQDRDADLASLMLHNYEDVLGMFSLGTLLAYPLIREEAAAIEKGRLSEDGFFILSCTLPVPVPVRLQAEAGFEGCTLVAEGRDCSIRLRTEEGTMLHFLPDYRDYYYLPSEDMVVHKSVAQFVDRAHRVKAKAENCCVKKEGRFLPVGKGKDLPYLADKKVPLFRRSYSEKMEYIEWSDACRQDGEFIRQLLSAVFSAGK